MSQIMRKEIQIKSWGIIVEFNDCVHRWKMILRETRSQITFSGACAKVLVRENAVLRKYSENRCCNMNYIWIYHPTRFVDHWLKTLLHLICESSQSHSRQLHLSLSRYRFTLGWFSFSHRMPFQQLPNARLFRDVIIHWLNDFGITPLIWYSNTSLWAWWTTLHDEILDILMILANLDSNGSAYPPCLGLAIPSREIARHRFRLDSIPFSFVEAVWPGLFNTRETWFECYRFSTED
jgi:hypothetical protein